MPWQERHVLSTFGFRFVSNTKHRKFNIYTHIQCVLFSFVCPEKDVLASSTRYSIGESCEWLCVCACACVCLNAGKSIQYGIQSWSCFPLCTHIVLYKTNDQSDS